MIDALVADAKITGTPIDGVDGLLNRMTKAMIEPAPQAEMTHELRYARDDPGGAGSGDTRRWPTWPRWGPTAIPSVR